MKPLTIIIDLEKHNFRPDMSQEDVEIEFTETEGQDGDEFLTGVEFNGLLVALQFELPDEMDIEKFDSDYRADVVEMFGVSE